MACGKARHGTCWNAASASVVSWARGMLSPHCLAAGPAGVSFPSNWDGYPIPFHRLLPADYTPRLGARPFDTALGLQAELPAGQDTYFREA